MCILISFLPTSVKNCPLKHCKLNKIYLSIFKVGYDIFLFMNIVYC